MLLAHVLSHESIDLIPKLSSFRFKVEGLLGGPGDLVNTYNWAYNPT